MAEKIRGSVDVFSSLKAFAGDLVPVTRGTYDKAVEHARLQGRRAKGGSQATSLKERVKDVMDTSYAEDREGDILAVETTVGEAAAYEALANRVVGVMETSGVPVGQVKDLKEAFKFAPSSSLAYTLSKVAERGSDRSYLRLLQDAIHAKSRTDVHIASIIHNSMHYVIGRGVSFRAVDSKVRDVLDRFVDENDWPLLCRELFVDGFKYGELPLLHIHVADRAKTPGKRGRGKKIGRHFLRSIPPQNIVEIEARNDYMNPLSFKRDPDGMGEAKRYAGVNYALRLKDPAFKEKSEHHAEIMARKDHTIQWMRYGPGGMEISGWPMLASVLRPSKLYEMWLIDRARRNHELSKVVWKKIIGKRAFDEDATTRERRPPRGSVMLVAIQGIVDYEPMAVSVAADRAADDGKAILYSMGSPVSMPIHILDQRADAAVYASIRKAESPYAQAILAQQYLWGYVYRLAFSYVLRSAVIAGELPVMSSRPVLVAEGYYQLAGLLTELLVDGVAASEVVEAIDRFSKKMRRQGKIEMAPVLTEKYPIDLMFAEIVGEDPLMQARTQQILYKLGVTSRDEIAAKFNQDYWVQRAKRRAELVQDLADAEELGLDVPMPDGGKKNDKIPGRPKGSRPGLGKESPTDSE